MAGEELPHLRRFGVLGDIHAEDRGLDVALDHFAREQVDAVLAVGDIVDGAGDAGACCRRLRDVGAHAVRGNHERWLLRGEMRHLADATREDAIDDEARAFLARLPSTKRFSTSLGDLLLCHGLGDDDMATVLPTDDGYGLSVNDTLWALVRTPGLRFVVCGHSHRAMVRAFEGVTVINAGTLSRHHDPRFVLVDMVARLVTFFELLADGVVTTADVIPI